MLIVPVAPRYLETTEHTSKATGEVVAYSSFLCGSDVIRVKDKERKCSSFPALSSVSLTVNQSLYNGSLFYTLVSVERV